MKNIRTFRKNIHMKYRPKYYRVSRRVASWYVIRMVKEKRIIILHAEQKEQNIKGQFLHKNLFLQEKNIYYFFNITANTVEMQCTQKIQVLSEIFQAFIRLLSSLQNLLLNLPQNVGRNNVTEIFVGQKYLSRHEFSYRAYNADFLVQGLDVEVCDTSYA